MAPHEDPRLPSTVLVRDEIMSDGVYQGYSENLLCWEDAI